MTYPIEMLEDARSLADKEELYESAFFTRLGRGRGRDKEFGGWKVPGPCDHLDFLNAADLTTRKVGRGQTVVSR